ncbi:MAG TPA: transglutaminase domain-containing protein [Planctomycetota bacterium]|nr:transglutaminase domain-containing protein [Planctomycetota bacterium]
MAERCGRRSDGAFPAASETFESPATRRIVRVLLALAAFAAAGAAQRPTTAAGLDPDTDGDGLSDFQERRKYRTDPERVDTARDGLPDGDVELRRDFTYTVRVVLRVMKPVTVEALNDDHQDVRVVAETADFVDLEVTHYPWSTAGDAIVGARGPRGAGADARFLAPGVTACFDATFADRLTADLKAAGLDVDAVDDAELVRGAAAFLMRRRRPSGGFTGYYTAFEDGRPVALPDLRAQLEKEAQGAGTSLEELWRRDLFATSMYAGRTVGACTSTAIYLAGCLRALGVPTRIVLSVPIADASDPRQLEMVREGVADAAVRDALLEWLTPHAAGAWFSHTYNEVWVAGRWRRLDATCLGTPPGGLARNGLMTRVAVLHDWSDGAFHATVGRRQALRLRDAAFPHANPYRAFRIEDRGPRRKDPRTPEVPVAKDRPPKTGASLRPESRPRPEELLAESRPSTLTLTAAFWEPEPETVVGTRPSVGAAVEYLSCRVREWHAELGFEVLKDFTRRADPVFTLVADGVAVAELRCTVGGTTSRDGALRRITLWMTRGRRADLRPGVAYELRPRNAIPDAQWAVAPELRVTAEE